MTIEGGLEAMGMGDVRATIRAVIERVEAGTPVVVLRGHGEPGAVLIRHKEAERWQRIERSLSALHGLRVYPEIVHDTAELEGMVEGAREPDPVAVYHLADTSRTILSPLRTVNITDARLNFARILDEAGQNRMVTIVSRGELAVAVIPPREFDRLRGLDRIVGWFRTAGLDLEKADDESIARFVNERRQGGSQRVEKAAG